MAKAGQRRKNASLNSSRPESRRGSTDSTSPSLLGLSSAVLWVCLGLIAVNVIVYSPVSQFGFVTWDDPQYVIQNPHVAAGLTWESIKWAFTSGLVYWQPLTWLSYMWDVQIHGVNPGSFHVTNLVLHTLSSLLLFVVLRQATSALARSAFVAALFAVHPLHVESVAWIAERKDVLSTFFWMLTFCGYVWYTRRPSIERYLMTLLAFLLALMAKPMVVTLPFALLLFDYWPLGRIQFDSPPPVRAGLRLVWEKAPFLLLAAVSAVVTVINQKQAGALDMVIVPFPGRFANALVSYAAYVRDLLWPAGLAAYYPYRQLNVTEVVVGALFLVAASAAVVVFGKGRPYLGFGWLWYLGTLLPVIGLIQAGDQSMADRFTYIPLIGLFVIVAWMVPELVGKWKYSRAALGGAAVCAIMSCMVVSKIQVQYWRDSLSLWARAADVTAGNARAHNHLGVALDDAGKTDEAIVHYHEALRLQPGLAEAHTNLGAALAEKGRTEEAIAQYREALRLKPSAADARNNLAAALDSLGHGDEAIQELTEAIETSPENAVYHYNLGLLYQQKGAAADARRHFQAALALDPGYQDARRALGNTR